jgi:lipopolysaccharide biosynthesis regulator YciM
MEFDFFTWVFIFTILGFFLGWLASRIDFRQMRLENRESPKAYFKGLNLLLNEQQDQAIDAFIEAVQQDPDTYELHLALGSLFRRRGEYERAIRIHEHLLTRGNLKTKEHAKVQYELAQDYLKAGLLNFAENTLQKLQHTSYQLPANITLLAIYERTREWKRALDLAERLKLDHKNLKTRHTHFLVETAQLALKNEQYHIAESLLNRAIQLSPEHPRAPITLAELLYVQEKYNMAFQIMQGLFSRGSKAAILSIQNFSRVAKALGKETIAIQHLRTYYVENPSTTIAKAIADLQTDKEQNKTAWYDEHLKHRPSLVAASYWIKENTANKPLQQAIEKACRHLLLYRCHTCGFEPSHFSWQCPGCLQWDTYNPQPIEEH